MGRAGRRREAHVLLALVYGWFNRGVRHHRPEGGGGAPVRADVSGRCFAKIAYSKGNIAAHISCNVSRTGRITSGHLRPCARKPVSACFLRIAATCSRLFFCCRSDPGGAGAEIVSLFSHLRSRLKPPREFLLL